MPDQSPEFYMLEGISAAEDDDLQRRANALEGKLFRRRIKEPGKLLIKLRAALRAEGFVRVRVKWLSTVLLFRAELGRRLKARRFSDDVLYGQVTRAARQCGLDPRIEDVGIRQRSGGIEGSVSPVPFTVVTAALNKMLDRWVVPGVGRQSARAAQSLTLPPGQGSILA